MKPSSDAGAKAPVSILRKTSRSKTPLSSPDLVLGIDFGTSNSAVAWVDSSGESQLIPIEGSATSMPTALFFDAEERATYFGRAALEAYRGGNDGRIMRSLKSLLGSDLMDERTEILGQLTSYRDLISFYLAELKRRAESELQRPVEQVVIGRPVHFVDEDEVRDQLAQDTLALAAKGAGLKVLQFELEPVAAALDFQRTLSQQSVVLVADIGGGTSDFTLMNLAPLSAKEKSGQVKSRNRPKVLATSGIHRAGTDFDRAISLGHVMPLLGLGHIGLRNREVPRRIFFELATWHRIHFAQSARELAAARELTDTYADTAMYQRLIRLMSQRFGHQVAADVELAKIEGSADPQARVKINLQYLEESLAAIATGGQIMQTLENDLDLIGQCAEECVSRAGLRKNDVQIIYLTGGSSALPAFQQKLAERFPQAQLISGNLFGSVASGLVHAVI